MAWESHAVIAACFDFWRCSCILSYSKQFVPDGFCYHKPRWTSFLPKQVMGWGGMSPDEPAEGLWLMLKRQCYDWYRHKPSFTYGGMLWLVQTQAFIYMWGYAVIGAVTSLHLHVKCVVMGTDTHSLAACFRSFSESARRQHRGHPDVTSSLIKKWKASLRQPFLSYVQNADKTSNTKKRAACLSFLPISYLFYKSLLRSILLPSDLCCIQKLFPSKNRLTVSRLQKEKEWEGRPKQSSNPNKML